MEITRISASSRDDLNHIVRLLEDCNAIDPRAVQSYKNHPNISVIAVDASFETVNAVLSQYLNSSEYPYTSFQLA